MLAFARNAKQSIMRVAGRRTKAVLFSDVPDALIRQYDYGIMIMGKFSEEYNFEVSV